MCQNETIYERWGVLQNWLRCLRTEKTLTQNRTAYLAGISRSHYANIENGVRLPSVSVAKALGKVLGFSWTKFYEESNQ